MKYLLIETEDGIYTKGGKKYDVLECHEAIGPRASEFVEFANLEQAKKHYGLTEL